MTGRNRATAWWLLALGVVVVVTATVVIVVLRQPVRESTALRLDVVGLPSGAAPRAWVDGPGGRRAVAAGTTLSRPGTYTVTAQPVKTPHATHPAAVPEQVVTVAPGEQRTATVDYFATIPDDTRIVPDESEIRAVTGDRVVLRDGAYARGLRPGMFIVAGRGPATPGPYAGQVVSLRSGSGTVVAQVRRAALTEAIPKMVVLASGESGPATAPAGRAVPAAFPAAPQPPAPSGSNLLQVDTTSFRCEGSPPEVLMGIGQPKQKIWFNIHIDAQSPVTADYNKWGVPHVKVRSPLKVAVQPEITTTMDVGFRLSGKVGAKCNLITIDGSAATDQVCNAVVRGVTKNPAVYAKCYVGPKIVVEAKAYTKIDVGAYVTVAGTIKAGFSDEGWRQPTLKREKPVVHPLLYELGKGNVGLTLKSGHNNHIEIGIGTGGSPTDVSVLLDEYFYVRHELANDLGKQTITYTAGLGAEVKFGVHNDILDALGKDKTKTWNKDWDVYSHTWSYEDRARWAKPSPTPSARPGVAGSWYLRSDNFGGGEHRRDDPETPTLTVSPDLTIVLDGKRAAYSGRHHLDSDPARPGAYRFRIGPDDGVGEKVFGVRYDAASDTLVVDQPGGGVGTYARIR